MIEHFDETVIKKTEIAYIFEGQRWIILQQNLRIILKIPAVVKFYSQMILIELFRDSSRLLSVHTEIIQPRLKCYLMDRVVCVLVEELHFRLRCPVIVAATRRK